MNKMIWVSIEVHWGGSNMKDALNLKWRNNPKEGIQSGNLCTPTASIYFRFARIIGIDPKPLSVRPHLARSFDDFFSSVSTALCSSFFSRRLLIFFLSDSRVLHSRVCLHLFCFCYVCLGSSLSDLYTVLCFFGNLGMRTCRDAGRPHASDSAATHMHTQATIRRLRPQVVWGVGRNKRRFGCYRGVSVGESIVGWWSWMPAKWRLSAVLFKSNAFAVKLSFA